MGISYAGGEFMQVYKWTDSLKTNIDKIDNDHKLIISKAQELADAMSQGKGKGQIVETLGFLQKYVKTHFAEEEIMQQKAKFSDIEMHKKNHTYFINELDKLSSKIAQDPTSTVNVIELNRLISGWFMNHIQKMDVEVAKHINGNNKN